MASVGWGLLLLVTLAGGYLFLTDEEQPARLIAGFYRLIGFSSEADAIEEFGLNPLLSKLIIALVALVLGVARNLGALFHRQPSPQHFLRAIPSPGCVPTCSWAPPS